MITFPVRFLFGLPSSRLPPRLRISDLYAYLSDQLALLPQIACPMNVYEPFRPQALAITISSRILCPFPSFHYFLLSVLWYILIILPVAANLYGCSSGRRHYSGKTCCIWLQVSKHRSGSSGLLQHPCSYTTLVSTSSSQYKMTDSLFTMPKTMPALMPARFL